MRWTSIHLLVGLALALLPAGASAQPLGPFTWQLQPFCNRISVVVVQGGMSYTLDGFDDQCGATQVVPVVGSASLNPDGTVQLGFTMVVSTGVPVHVTARVTLASGNGAWQDNFGRSGAFMFGGAAAGSPRPLPTTTLADGSVNTTALADDAVNAAKIASGAVGLSDINALEVQQRITGACSGGQSMIGVNADGSVACLTAASSSGDITGVGVGSGLTGGGSSGDVTLAVASGGVDGTMLAPNAVDSSKIAAGAVGASDVDSAQVQLRVSGTCTAGSAVRVVSANGSVTCESTAGGGGDITSVTAGTALTGGGTLGDVTLGVSFAGSGVAASAAHSDHTHAIAGSDNTAVGSLSLLNNTGSGNTASGSTALASNTTGANNTASGLAALYANTTGVFNTASGANALAGNTDGSFNTALGAGAIVTAGNLTNATAIGANAAVDASNKLRLGNTSVTVIEGQVGFTAASDRHKKEHFLRVDGEDVLRKLRTLEVSSWNYIGHDPKQFRHYGPMAQDFFAAFGHDGAGTIGTDTTITSTDIDGILMSAVKATEERTADLQQRNTDLQGAVHDLEQAQAATQAQLADARALLATQGRTLETLQAALERLQQALLPAVGGKH